MIKKTIKTDIYITKDGQEYQTKKQAEEHEIMIDISEQLRKYRIEGPKFLPYNQDPPMMADTGYEWYKAENQKELASLIHLLSKQHKRIHYSPIGTGFPVIIAYNSFRNKMIDIENLRAIRDRYEQEWNELLNAIRPYERGQNYE